MPGSANLAPPGLLHAVHRRHERRPVGRVVREAPVIRWPGAPLAVALLLVLGAPPPVRRPAWRVLLDARRATPGIQLELVEIPAGAGLERAPISAPCDRHPARRDIRRLDEGVRRLLPAGLDGISPGRDWSVGRPRREWAAAAARPDELEPGPYPRGAAWEVGLVSDDGTVTSFARVIPRPIAAQDGACAVSLELVSRRGDRFIASGSGFAPGEEVTVESEDSGRIVQKRQRVDGDGRLAPDVVAHRRVTPIITPGMP